MWFLSDTTHQHRPDNNKVAESRQRSRESRIRIKIGTKRSRKHVPYLLSNEWSTWTSLPAVLMDLAIHVRKLSPFRNNNKVQIQLKPYHSSSITLKLLRNQSGFLQLGKNEKLSTWTDNKIHLFLFWALFKPEGSPKEAIYSILMSIAAVYIKMSKSTLLIIPGVLGLIRSNENDLDFFL